MGGANLDTKSFPSSGKSWSIIQNEMSDMRSQDAKLREGRSALHYYSAGDDVTHVAREAYMMFISESGLAPGAFPSLVQMESEVVSGMLELHNARECAAGSITTGGTESIFLAMKAAREWFRKSRPRLSGTMNLILPRTAHPAFDKAAHYLGLLPVRVSVGYDYRADVGVIERAITDNTAMIVGSAPNLPYGCVDPIKDLGTLAEQYGVWLHVDACIGGCLAPFAKRLGHPIPDYDFAIPGVHSISADIHKFGYAAKGVSVILYANGDLHEYQKFEMSNWPKGGYRTPTFTGTRSGGGIASAWAVMNYLGMDGYTARAKRALALWQRYIDIIISIDDCAIIGKPDLAVVAFSSPTVDIFAVAEEMSRLGWYVSRVAEPRGMHQIVNLAHEQACESYFEDLRKSMRVVRTSSSSAECAYVETY